MPLKTCREERLMHVQSVVAQSLHVGVDGGRYQLRCCPPHMTQGRIRWQGRQLNWYSSSPNYHTSPMRGLLDTTDLTCISPSTLGYRGLPEIGLQPTR
ncbi:hypothetical protein TNCV_4354461 [Trichonephila clavipes]|nr:hypothetical protein TNCV_4354461 [Trichonephila clavipes]